MVQSYYKRRSLLSKQKLKEKQTHTQAYASKQLLTLINFIPILETVQQKQKPFLIYTALCSNLPLFKFGRLRYFLTSLWLVPFSHGFPQSCSNTHADGQTQVTVVDYLTYSSTEVILCLISGSIGSSHYDDVAVGDPLVRLKVTKQNYYTR